MVMVGVFAGAVYQTLALNLLLRGKGVRRRGLRACCVAEGCVPAWV